MLIFTANKQQEAPGKDPASPQLLSTLFPQTAVSDQTPEVKEEQQKQEEGVQFPRSMIQFIKTNFNFYFQRRKRNRINNGSA